MTEDEKAKIDAYMPDRIPDGAPARPKVHRNSRPRWNDNQWKAAAMRSRSKPEPWSVISEYLGVSTSTLTKYVCNLEGWTDLESWFKTYWQARRIDDFLVREEDNVLDITDLAFDCIRSILKGDAGPDGKKPSQWLQANVAFKFFDTVGYSEAKRIMSTAQVERMLEDPEVEDANDDTETDPRIEYEDDDTEDYEDAELVDIEVEI